MDTRSHHDPDAIERHFTVVVDDLSYRYEGTFTREQVRAAVDLARAELEPGSVITDYLPVLVERHARQRLLDQAGHDVDVRTTPELLFVCVHNAGRSQMAAALATHLSAGRVHVRSAGSAPSGQVLPTAVQALAERGIELSAEFPKALTDDVVHAADVIVTMGCGDACPVLPGKRYLDWDVADPEGQPIEVVRSIRDDIQARVTSLLAEVLDPTR